MEGCEAQCSPAGDGICYELCSGGDGHIVLGCQPCSAQSAEVSDVRLMLSC